MVDQLQICSFARIWFCSLPLIACAIDVTASPAVAQSASVAQWANPPNPYVINSSGDMNLQLLAGAPAGGNVVFQTWSIVTQSIQAAVTDWQAPFVYPASFLNTVTPGGAEVQALVRNSNNQVVEIVRHVTTFTQPTPTGTPTPVISIISSTGMAPFTVHVHGLNSTLANGNENTARYEWDFGDAGSPYNKLVGWNAAHTYNQPGTYTITLRVINQSRAWAIATRQVTVNPDTRSVIYVSPTGNDANAGTSTAAPVQTFARAAQLLANNRAILFQRGGTYNTNSTMYINKQNVLIGAYGAGNVPVFKYTSSTNYAKIIEFGGAAASVIVENARFDSNFTPNNMIVRGLQPAAGTNLTVRNCFFNKVSYAMNCGGGGPNGLLVQSNHADAIGAYFIWGEGASHTYLGNTVVNSIDEHNIRIGGVSKFLIAHNDLANDSKATIWCMLGDHAWIANNILRTGRFIAGPNFAVSSSNERFPWLVFEGNQILGQGVVLYSGAENMVFRNNVIKNDGGDCFSIWGYYPQWNRTCTNITVANTTATNHSSQWGKFVKLGAGAVNVTVVNNLYCATTLNQPGSAGNVITDDPTLAGHSFHHNLWANSAVSSYVHATSTGSKTAAQWNGYAQTSDEMYRSYVPGDINSAYAPTFGASIGCTLDPVLTDFNGNFRPTGGVWTVGAVELNPVPGPNANPADINGDGVVNVQDLLLVMSNWGTCAGSCPGDVTGDGVVNVSDLLAVIAAWV